MSVSLFFFYQDFLNFNSINFVLIEPIFYQHFTSKDYQSFRVLFFPLCNFFPFSFCIFSCISRFRVIDFNLMVQLNFQHAYLLFKRNLTRSAFLKLWQKLFVFAWCSPVTKMNPSRGSIFFFCKVSTRGVLKFILKELNELSSCWAMELKLAEYSKINNNSAT